MVLCGGRCEEYGGSLEGYVPVTSMENLINYLQENPPEINRRIGTLPKFHARVSNAVRALARMIAENPESPKDAKKVHDQMTRHIRAKLGQGKSWSRGFVNAFVQDALAQALESVQQATETQDEEE